MYDTIIIGGGPAGITASLYIKRAGFNVLVITKGESALNKAKKIENYYGFEKPISGRVLTENGEKQAKASGVNILKKEDLNQILNIASEEKNAVMISYIMQKIKALKDSDNFTL